MRNKIIILLSVILLTVLIIFVYKSISGKSINDYIENDESAFDIVIDNYSFYGTDVSSINATNASNMMTLLGLSDDVIVAEEYVSSDMNIDDFNRDIIIEYADELDYSSPIYSVENDDYYFVWYETDGTLRGLHLDSEYNLIELR